MGPIHQLAPAHARFIHDLIIIKTRIEVKLSFAAGPKFFGARPARQSAPPGFPAGQAKSHGELFEFAMSVLFFKRFLKRPFQIASIMPSSRALVERVASKIDFDRARVIAEYGPGEGVHSRALAQRMRPDAQLLLFELDPHFSRVLARQFAGDPRVRVINANAATIRSELIQRGIAQCDYIISGIPFSILEKEKKRNLLQQTHEALAPGGAFIIYQVTNELRQHATDFASAASEYFLQNIPPMFITVFRKAGEDDGNGAIDPAESRFSSNYAR
jgi:phosphatidylethanolamine/phosphatidyl-N-methylethanolamine N-methyltransferase